MTKTFARASLALWKRRLTYREKRLRAARRVHSQARANKWEKAIIQAQRMMALRRRQLAQADRPVPAKGIDVSNLQGHIDFAAVKRAGYRFAWIKAGEGDWNDPTFLHNVKAAKAAGLKVGAYHFLRPKPGRNGEQEAVFFIARLREAGLGVGDLRPAADVEATKLGDDATRAYAWAFVRKLRAVGYKPVLYTYPSFLGASWGDTFKSTPLWLADYDGPLNVPKPWTHPVAHQYTSKGKVAGIRGDVDLNRTDDLRSLIA